MAEIRFIGRDIGIIVSSLPLEPQLILISCPNRLRIMTVTTTFREEEINNSWKFNLL